MQVEGKIVENPFGSFESTGLYLGHEEVETIFRKYRNQTIRVTIEVIEDEPEEISYPDRICPYCNEDVCDCDML